MKWWATKRDFSKIATLKNLIFHRIIDKFMHLITHIFAQTILWIRILWKNVIQGRFNIRCNKNYKLAGYFIFCYTFFLFIIQEPILVCLAYVKLTLAFKLLWSTLVWGADLCNWLWLNIGWIRDRTLARGAVFFLPANF